MENERYEKEIALSAMKWHGWGSPIGLSIFFLSLACSIFIVCKAFFA